ncbi:Gfo/Idh/MocA family protein [Mesorhizobium marinum]|uniref:Gfo/Idh/MocA family protein n=1 Tax=Mesorhizobium marinum TaxID=3228790 RepID=UPI0034651D1E
MSSRTPIRLGIVGVGKIVRDQHLPALEKDADYLLVAAASRNATVEGVANFTTIDDMLASDVAIDAVSLCQPPQVRYQAARAAIEAGKHVFLEKPPGASVSEVEDLKAAAAQNGVSLFASWHSRYAPAVEAARSFLAATTLRSAAIEWKEDVRRWHPNQDWIWRAGGFGVFDPGINALSIATHILPPMYATSATLHFPDNRDAPIAAQIDFRASSGQPVSADFDWRQTGPQTWNITADTEAGQMLLSLGGARLEVDGRVLQEGPDMEYPMLYRRFAEIVHAGASDADIAPLQHVADAFMLGRRSVVEAFHD